MDSDVRWVVERKMRELDYILTELEEVKADVFHCTFSFALDDIRNAVNSLREVLAQ